MNINNAIKEMTLEEKIGQKIMLDFRYWNPLGETNQDMIEPNEQVEAILSENHIGGIILFSNNLKERVQIERLTAWFATFKTQRGLRLFVATDNEGGNVFRLPREHYSSFPGNMALAAAFQGGCTRQLAYEQGKKMAQDMMSLNINTNFAPVVDVNDNPANPVINVRAFSDSTEVVDELATLIASGMNSERVISAYKHFPGHGSTSTDSHTSLPYVSRTREEALAIDIAPYKSAIDSDHAPDMIMTAHIQYPSLDNSVVNTSGSQEIIVPATMSHAIQTTLLRNELGFQGVTITDALDMGAIANHFNHGHALELVFKAGVDIALMPISISTAQQACLLPALVKTIADKVRIGELSEAEIDMSVERILRLKQRYGLCGEPQATSPISRELSSNLEKNIADAAITVVINKQATLPLTSKTKSYFILTPWSEQGDGIAKVLTENGYYNVITARESDLDEAGIKACIDKCDIFLLASLVTSFTPAESTLFSSSQDSDAKLSYFQYAKSVGKTAIHLALRAPYDIINYAEIVDASVTSYSYFGYTNGTWRGPSMISLTEVIIGKLSPVGKLPVNIWSQYDSETNTGTVAFPRGFGLRWD
ncbi:glycoside hydrolase family 3 N-terminal domain-containing protein [Pseudomonas fluorescens]|uniref:glycoside hydrolase family 3 N-terminal domain-containing protein n=1 Tax=Pseudomonas fluorescens TaxID=294 RepID=UPI001BE9D167|nr:glycoside hydrolase family 3 protein [Pseudomonas fluorescens]MBT2372394.1 hypothetical protein [Pseudomonas fluorescens]